MFGYRYWDSGFGFSICYPVIPLCGWFWNWSEELAPNIAHLSCTKERARPRFRGLPLCIRPKSLPFPSPTPRAYPFVTRLEKKKRERDSKERRRRWRRRREVVLHCGCAICCRALPRALVLVHLRPSSIVLPPCRSVFLLVSSTYPPSSICVYPRRFILASFLNSLSVSRSMKAFFPSPSIDSLFPNPNPFSLYFAGYLCQVFVVLQFD
jgi:hypothetical protein